MAKVSREEINKLHNRNIEIRKILNSDNQLPTNKRDELLNEMEENEFLIQEMESEISEVSIVPVTGTHTISEHKYTRKSSFARHSFRI